jgi:hypothetical protein
MQSLQTHQEGRDIYELVERGDVDQMSFRIPRHSSKVDMTTEAAEFSPKFHLPMAMFQLSHILLIQQQRVEAREAYQASNLSNQRRP